MYAEEEKTYEPQIKYYHIGNICGIHIAACMYTGRMHYWRPFERVSADIKSNNLKSKQLNLFTYEV